MGSRRRRVRLLETTVEHEVFHVLPFSERMAFFGRDIKLGDPKVTNLQPATNIPGKKMRLSVTRVLVASDAGRTLGEARVALIQNGKHVWSGLGFGSAGRDCARDALLFYPRGLIQFGFGDEFAVVVESVLDIKPKPKNVVVALTLAEEHPTKGGLARAKKRRKP